jgi:CRISPR-associated protein Cas5h
LKIPLTIFDVTGYFAHFRKYFSTASSLSYVFPPRTAITGMLAGILGYERDSYYELFSSNKCKIALRILGQVRRLTYTINYLMTDKPLTIGKLRGIGSSAQVHTEILSSGDRELHELRYRIFFNHEDGTVQKEIAERIADKKFYYPPSLGTANFIADLKYVCTIDGEIFKPREEVNICTVIPTSIVKSLHPQEGIRIYIEELMPADFSPERFLLRKETYIYEGSGKTIRALVDCQAFRCLLNGEEILGVFM